MKTLQILAFLMTISAALALTCYKCDSSQSKFCNYGFGSFTYDTVDCEQESKGSIFSFPFSKECVKFVTRDDQGTEYVARGCVPGIGTTACNALAKTMGFFSSIEGGVKDIECYTCDSDKCNSATRYTAFSMLGIVLAALAFLF